MALKRAMVRRKVEVVEDKLTTLQEAVSLVRDGGSLGIASPAVHPVALVPMATVREIVRQGKRDLRIFTAMGELETDLLIGGGCVAEVQFWACNFFGRGTPPNVRRAMEAGEVIAREHSEFSFTLGVLAGGMGLEFVPLHGFVNDHLQHHPEWRVFPSPFDGKDLLAVTAIAPDVALVHVAKADKYGNAQFGETNWDNVAAKFIAPNMVRAAKRVILTAEEIISNEEIRKTPEQTGILYHDVDAVVHAPHGAHPHGVVGYYEPDEAHIEQYFKAAQSPDAFRDYLATYVTEPENHDAYLKLVGAS